MAVAKKCDRCGKFYEGTQDRLFKTPEGFPVNAVRLGYWDNKKKEWTHIASAYDLCNECGSKLYDAVCGGNSSIVMHVKTNPKQQKNQEITAAKRPHDDNKAPEENAAASLEEEQKAFANTQEVTE